MRPLLSLYWGLEITGQAHIYTLTHKHTHTHSLTSTHIHTHSQTQANFTLALCGFGPYITGSAVVCRTRKLMLMQLALLPSSQLTLNTLEQKECVYVCRWGINRSLELIREGAVVGNGLRTPQKMWIWRNDQIWHDVLHSYILNIFWRIHVTACCYIFLIVDDDAST